MASNELLPTTVVEADLAITAEQRQAIDNLRQLVIAKNYPSLSNQALHRFLTYNSYNVDTTLTAIIAYLDWRRDNNIDNFVDPSPNKTELTFKLFPHCYYGNDHHHRPIYWEKTGKINVAALLQLLTIDEFIKSHYIGMEQLNHLCYQQSLKTNQLNDSFTAVFDLEGLSMNHAQAIQFISAVASFDNKYYPNKVAKILIINAPYIINFLYPMVTAILPSWIMERMEVITGDVKQGLLKYMNEDQILTEYGGSSGKSIVVEDISEILASVKQLSDSYQRQNVGAGSNFQQSITVNDDKNVVNYVFESEGSYDIDFQIDVKSASSSSSTSYKAKTRMIQDQGQVVVDGPAIITFTWDNTYSWMTSKDIKYMIAPAAADAPKLS